MSFKAETCCECGAILTEEEIDNFWKGNRCCKGYQCGCMGLPIRPPYCFKCIGKDDVNND